MSVGGVPILPLFEVYPGLCALVSDRDRYVREWVRVFYTTLFVDEDYQFIEFMFQGRHCTLTRQMLATLLGVPHTDEPHSLHHLTYGDVDPPHRPHQSYSPPDEEARRLFHLAFSTRDTEGTRQTHATRQDCSPSSTTESAL